MKEIKMVDLNRQYQKIKPEIDQAIADVIETTAFINGPAVKDFQADLEKYLNVKHVIPCANGTDALQIAMMALGLKPGDEVITTNFTFIATVEVIGLLGLTPVLVDVCPDTFNISPDKIRNAITDKTKAIVPVHLFGQCANMDEIMDIAREYKLFVIEDTAQAIGADYTFKDGSSKKAGTIGDIGTTSFFPSKNLGCYGDGGALFTNNDDIAESLRSIVNHGMKVRYYHDHIGVNSRLDSLQAAILKVKLQYLDDYNLSRQEAADFYNKAFRDSEYLEIPKINPSSTHIYHQYTLKTHGVDRVKLKEYLNSKGIPMMIYYPVPLHAQKAFEKWIKLDLNFPVTDDLCESVISLPIHTEMTLDELKYISQTVLEFFKK